MARRPVLTLAAAAILLLSPTLVLGTLISHSSPQNLTWAAQFADQFRAGIVYPRWMPQSFDGLGGPAFYFYPPLPFWLDGLVSVVTGNLLSVPYRLAVTTTLILFASGLAMHAWLRTQVENPSVALWGAIAWMAAPYHLLDLYMRGAFAEGTAFVFLPLVLLALRHPVLLAFAYAGLLMSHLPTALLVSLTILPAYIFARAPAPEELAKMLGGGVLGIGLAAIYWLPAMAAQSWISTDLLWSAAFYHADNWLLFFPDRWPEPGIMTILSLLAASYAVLALAALGSLRRPGFWASAVLVGLLLIAGAIPGLWKWPLLAKVQFPWRLMVAIEFAVITALCLAAPRFRSRAFVYRAAVGLACLFVVYLLLGRDIGARIDDIGVHPLAQQDVKEYEPRGFPIAPALKYEELGLEPVRDMPLIACAPAASRCEARQLPFGALQIDVESATAASVIVRRFYFPTWTADDPVLVTPTDRYRLVSFLVPAGKTSVLLRQEPLPVERWAWGLSAASLAALLAFTWFLRSSARRETQ